MKFTEGYWLRNERSNALYVQSVWEMQEIRGGMRLLAPMKRVDGRGDTVNVPCLTLEFTAVTPSAVRVAITHFRGYDTKKPKFSLKGQDVETEVEETETECILKTSKIQVRVKKNPFEYVFESRGQNTGAETCREQKVITRCGFRNLGYMRWNRQPVSMSPGEDYMEETRMKPYIVNELSLAPGEKIYGFGERFTNFVKNGQVIETWNEDGGTSSSIAYKSIPLYLTNRGYGVFVNHTGCVSFEAASEKVNYVGFSIEDESMEYIFMYGPDLHDVLKTYTDLSGKPALPPAWSFGLWLSTSFTTDYDENTVSSFVNGMKERKIPLSVFHYDCFWMKEFRLCDFRWDEKMFPDPEGMIQRNHEKGLKVCVWLNPYIAQNTALFREAAEKGYLLMRADGKGIFQTDNWEYGMGLVDFTNPGAVAWYKKQLIRLMEKGVDCFKADFGERIPINVSYWDGSDPEAMHNYYSYLYNKCVFECLEERKGEGNAVLFSRSATAGCQRFPVHWGGDCMASYASMAETLRGGLSLSLCGFGFWSHDISGFEDTATPDLYKRWAAFGLLSSHSRLHGSSSYRVPWLFDEEAVAVVRFFSELKCRLMPYLYLKAVEAHEEGIPVMRPMVLEFMRDPAVQYLDMQYMLGDELLVAPIFREDGETEYYLPKGKWTDFFTEEVKEGGRWYHGKYDYMSLPFYVRENTILPIGLRSDRPDYDYEKNLEIFWYEPGENGSAETRIVGQKGEEKGRIYAWKHENEAGIHIEGDVEPAAVWLISDGRRQRINPSASEQKKG